MKIQRMSNRLATMLCIKRHRVLQEKRRQQRRQPRQGQKNIRKGSPKLRGKPNLRGRTQLQGKAKLRVRANLQGLTKLQKRTGRRQSAANVVRKPQMMRWCIPARLRALAEGAKNMEDKTKQKRYQLEGRAEKERKANTQLVETLSSGSSLAAFEYECQGANHTCNFHTIGVRWLRSLTASFS